MRPLRLSLQAFGSYAGELTVDFARLARHGVFAITGPTGAGKSTIFDALVYALYDDLPGFRVDGNVRSQYADPSTETRVCFEFEVHGEEWRIERRPAQPAPRKRGTGAPIERASTVVLERPGEGGSARSRKAEVAAKLDELLGLSKEQFEQVVLIPQGKFEEVLKAETAKRAPLLRRLFPVDVFGRVTDELKATAAARQADFDEATRDRAALVGRLREALATVVAQLPDGTETWWSAEALGPERFVPEAIDRHLVELRRLRRVLDAAAFEASATAGRSRAALDAARSACERWAQWQADLAAAAAFPSEEADDDAEEAALERGRRLGHLERALEQWQRVGEELESLAADEAAAAGAVRASWVAGYEGPVPEASGQAALLAQRVARDAGDLAEAAERFGRLEADAAALVDGRRELDTGRADLARAEVALGEEALELAALAAEIERLTEEASGADRSTATIEVLRRELELAGERERIVEARARLVHAAAAAADRAAGCRASADEVRAAWRNGLAGRLAELLVDGEPCPTCGAPDHPLPASPRPGAPDDDALTSAEAAQEVATAEWRRLERRLGAADGALDALAAGRDAATVAAELAHQQATLERIRSSAGRRETVASAHEDRATRLEAARAGAEAERRRLDMEWATLEARASAHEEARRGFVVACGDYRSPAPRAGACATFAGALSGLAEVLERRERADATRQSLATVLQPTAEAMGVGSPADLAGWVVASHDLDARQRAITARRDRRRDVRRRIHEYERAGDPDEMPDLVPLEAAADRATARHLDLVGRQAVIATQAAVLADGPDAFEAASKEVDSARRALEHARTVAEQCAGLGAGTVGSRLSLENWVLADYLRQVLVQANGRLGSMTDGRYSLELSEGVTDGRKAWGLDLAAFDANTGQVRPATTLSGGETFMAALALALGLADVVSGGSNRHIGALFVDEGFGSLDPQALDAVIDVLRSLEDGGRVVGVISHVDDVQQALPTGITVAPSPAGSVAYVHYPPE